MIPKVHLHDYQYDLPEERIRKFPLQERDSSKLLVYKNGTIEHQDFGEIKYQLPDGSALFFNNTKVIPARLYFEKDTGAVIEIFLLNPVSPSPLVVEAMTITEPCEWNCMVGNMKKWKEKPLISRLTIDGKELKVEADLIDRETKRVRFSWNDDTISFAEIVEAAGEVPLPPYFQRKPIPEDKERYQTVYSKNKGAVAAPTAGLHFTNSILAEIKQNGHFIDYLTLHVSAGTFQPVKELDATNHPMHSEQVVITRENIENLISQEKIIAVGTTSLRTLESLYWYGAMLMHTADAIFQIEKLYPYQLHKNSPDRKEAFKNVLAHMAEKGIDTITGETEIFIFPGYKFRVCDGLITNFHQPGSTLLMLIAAFIGEDWKNLYQQALDNDYQFLSYGDSSLLIP